MTPVQPLLDVRDLSVAFRTREGSKEILSGVTLRVGAGEIVGLVGESGSGKSVTSKMILRLLEPRLVARVSGQILFEGSDLLKLDDEALRRLRGRRIAYVPQEPMSALNPTVRVGQQLELVLREHFNVRGKAARDRSASTLEQLQVRDPERVLRAYPFELSGGLRQRVILASAFMCEPSLLVADEPTTALDATIQAEILDILERRARESRASVLFITHNMGVVWRLCDTTYVMRAGRIVENGETKSLLTDPSSEYCRQLLSALPERNRPRTKIAAAP